MSEDDIKRKDFVVEVRMVFPKAVSRAELREIYSGSTLDCAISLIGTERRIPKDFRVVVAGVADDGSRYLK